jgi:hypothetical protein
MPATQPIYQFFPNRRGTDSMQRIGSLEVLENGEMRVVLDAYPAFDGASRLCVLAPQQSFPQEARAPGQPGPQVVQRPIHQYFPGRHGAESMQRVGSLEIVETGEMRIALDAYPAPNVTSHLVVLVPKQNVPQAQAGGLPGFSAGGGYTPPAPHSAPPRPQGQGQ